MQNSPLDATFRALADPTRRSVIERLGRGPASTSALAAPFQMALPSFLQHLRLLEEGGLVRSRKVGRVRTWQLSPAPLRAVEGWLHQQETLWNRRLDQLDTFLSTQKDDPP